MKDLHIHTKYSDGEFDEYQILEQIKKSNVTEFAICDHDTIEGSKRVFEVLKNNENNFIFHSGIELTCRFCEYKNGVNMHILFYDFDYNNEKLLEIITNISALRRQKVDKMVEYVEREYNISIPKDKLEERLKNTKSFAKPHLYSIMQEIGDFDREQYYRKMDKLDTSNLKLNTFKTLLTLKGCGKIVLAHPIEIMREYNFDLQDIENIVAKLKTIGLGGIEAYHSSQTKEVQEGLSKLAKKYDLIETKGSDYHGPNVKPGLNIGDVEKLYNSN